ncbi:nitroreductase/quinone reductase family protein [Actinomadura rugatobispora]|uniref:Nitroreductase/quinone reductase family protein n=1 Tax=Actinomadura rugatobispora TaxID=1994 RepID=A0ABW0ZSC9_9ACTN|nr:nitroreductase/quinone reductase family protein [Actinomadura rugatobispora]
MPHDFNKQIIQEFRANGGRVGGPFEGAVLALLTTTGARTGARRTSPVGFVTEGGRYLVVASAAGAPRHPAWYHNLLAEPRVTLEIGDGERIRTITAIAAPAEGRERERLFARILREAPGFADYQKRTSRVLPVVVLDPVGSPDGGARARAAGDELVELHNAFRHELAALRSGIGATLDGGGAVPAAGPPAFTAELREHCLWFCTSLERHHTGEDMVVFEVLLRRFPELGPVLESLRDEHARVAEIRKELAGLAGEAGAGDPARIRAELERLGGVLEAHLDREETQLVPLLNRLDEVPWPRIT